MGFHSRPPTAPPDCPLLRFPWPSVRSLASTPVRRQSPRPGSWPGAPRQLHQPVHRPGAAAGWPWPWVLLPGRRVAAVRCCSLAAAPPPSPAAVSSQPRCPHCWPRASAPRRLVSDADQETGVIHAAPHDPPPCCQPVLPPRQARRRCYCCWVAARAVHLRRSPPPYCPCRCHRTRGACLPDGRPVLRHPALVPPWPSVPRAATDAPDQPLPRIPHPPAGLLGSLHPG